MGYKIRLGDLSRDIRAQAILDKLIQDMCFTLEKMVSLGLTPAAVLGTPADIRSEIREVVTSGAAASGASYATLTFRSYRTAILAAWNLNRWQANRDVRPAGFPANRPYYCSTAWLLPHIHGLEDNFGAAPTTPGIRMGQPERRPQRAAPAPRVNREQLRQEAADRLGSTGYSPFDTQGPCGAYPGNEAPRTDTARGGRHPGSAADENPWAQEGPSAGRPTGGPQPPGQPRRAGGEWV